MSIVSALLFSWVQAAPAYRQLHREAVAHLGDGHGRTWIDVGCGPGLVAQLAAERGFRTSAIDTDPAMVRLASRRSTSAAALTAWVADAADPIPRHDVVSAASLLCQLPDPERGLQTLWSAVQPGGALLVIETTEQMSSKAVRQATAGLDRHSQRVLNRWASARSGHALSQTLWEYLPATSTTRLSLLDGCVAALIFEKRQLEDVVRTGTRQVPAPDSQRA